MTTTEFNASRIYSPSRPIGGLGESSSDLFAIEGLTNFNWFDADQEEFFWIPHLARQIQHHILPPVANEGFEPDPMPCQMP